MEREEQKVGREGKKYKLEVYKMRFSGVVRASNCPFQSLNSPGLNTSILRHTVISDAAAGEAVLKYSKQKISKKTLKNLLGS
jgi:hypothetical protein